MKRLQTDVWQGHSTMIFWGELAPSDHVVHFYKSDAAILDSLSKFTTDGLGSGEAVIIIATSDHLRGLEDRLLAQDLDLGDYMGRDQYIPVDAEAMLSEFVVNGWPDEALFRNAVMNLLDRARQDGRRVRAFGELVALLWMRGHRGATVQLEYLWHNMCESEDFALYCAYPMTGFAQDPLDSVREINEAHTRAIGLDLDAATPSLDMPPGT